MIGFRSAEGPSGDGGGNDVETPQGYKVSPQRFSGYGIQAKTLLQPSHQVWALFSVEKHGVLETHFFGQIKTDCPKVGGEGLSFIPSTPKDTSLW